MTHWNYRVCKRTYTESGEPEVYYGIHETYYDDKGNICAITQDLIDVFGESIEELKETLARMSKALEKEVIDLDTFSFSPPASVEDEKGEQDAGVA